MFLGPSTSTLQVQATTNPQRATLQQSDSALPSYVIDTFQLTTQPTLRREEEDN
jgi:hypothetical protein